MEHRSHYKNLEIKCPITRGERRKLQMKSSGCHAVDEFFLPESYNSASWWGASGCLQIIICIWLKNDKNDKKKVLATKIFDLELIFYPEIDHFKKKKIYWPDHSMSFHIQTFKEKSVQCLSNSSHLEYLNDLCISIWYNRILHSNVCYGTCAI